MAMRRSRDEGDVSASDDERFIGDADGGGFPLTGGGRTDEFGNLVPDFSNDPNFPVPFEDYQPDEIAGNTEAARDLRGGGMPTSMRQPQQDTSGLPNGVSVNDSQMDTPTMPTEPTPLSAFPARPVSSQSPAMTSGPVRRSAQNPAIFAENRSSMMHGRAGGLMGGGLGAAGGGEPSGAIAPTEMMKKLLQLFQQQ